MVFVQSCRVTGVAAAETGRSGGQAGLERKVTCEQADRQLGRWVSCGRKSETRVMATQARAEQEEGQSSHSFNAIWSVPMASGAPRGAGDRVEGEADT